jgi:hypothetical protein
MYLTEQASRAIHLSIGALLVNDNIRLRYRQRPKCPTAEADKHSVGRCHPDKL